MQEILLVLRLTALRPGELRELRWDHVRLGEDIILIPPAEHKTGNTSKTPQDRLVPYQEEVKNIFLRRKLRWGHQPYVFPNPAIGGPYTDELWSRRFFIVRKRAGLDAPDNKGELIYLYSLRHSRLSEVGTAEGWDYSLVQRYAGHQKAQTTSRYIHPSKDNLVRALKEGEALRKGRKAD